MWTHLCSAVLLCGCSGFISKDSPSENRTCMSQIYLMKEDSVLGRKSYTSSFRETVMLTGFGVDFSTKARALSRWAVTWHGAQEHCPLFSPIKMNWAVVDSALTRALQGMCQSALSGSSLYLSCSLSLCLCVSISLSCVVIVVRLWWANLCDFANLSSNPDSPQIMLTPIGEKKRICLVNQ